MSAIIKKISVKTVCGAVEPPAAGEKKDLLRVYGVASGIKEGESAYGPFTALLGDFKAVNLLTGEVVRAAKAFLPDVALDLIKPAVIANQGGVEFAFDITVVGDPSSSVKYFYTATPLLAAKESDPVSAIENLLPKVAALPAPDAGKEAKPAKATK